MGWRFRKSFKLLPGIRLNIGRKGISSATIGKRGLSASVGRQGVFRNIGLPGTGLSHRSKIGEIGDFPFTAVLLIGLAMAGATILVVILLTVFFVGVGSERKVPEVPQPVRLVSNAPMSPTPTQTPATRRPKSVTKKKSRTHG
jgi:hypothetical protein